MKNQNNNSFIEIDDSINLRDELEKYLIYWKWFLLSICFSLFGAYLYLRYTPPEYSAKAVVLIKDDKKGGVDMQSKILEDLPGFGGANSNVDNEIEIIKSRKLVGDVIKDLNLNISYFRESRVTESEVYKPSVKFEFINRSLVNYELDTAIVVKVISKSQYELLSDDGETKTIYNFNETVKSKLGKFKVVFKSGDFVESENLKTIVRISSLANLIDSYKEQVIVTPINKKSSVVNLQLNSNIKRKAEDFLNTLIKVYNKDAIADKNLVSEKTNEFLYSRLKLVKKDLDSINSSLKNFKTKNELSNIEEESKLILGALAKNNTKIIETSIQFKLSESLKDDLLKENKNDQTLATNIGLDDVSIGQTIIKYNELVLVKLRLLKTATKNNPQVIAISDQIEVMKLGLYKSLQNFVNGMSLTLEELNDQNSKIKAKISGVPIQELELRDIGLQQEITMGLYSYLLKKKEETAISLAVTVANAKIIDEAYSSGRVVSPKKKIIYLIGIVLGLITPFFIVFFKNLFDTKIHNKADVQETVSVPFLGDVPRSEEKSKIVIGSDARSSTAEAFRLIRTNLDFMMMDKKGKSKTIFITSTTSGEGKSFISVNVAASLALSGKKVLLMGMDLRAPKVTEYLGVADRKGVTNYITDDGLDLDSLIFNIDDVKGLDIISSGVVPPNPAELLMTKRVENLFTIVKEEYDYIIVDTAPVNLVTDTLLIAKYADMFIYVARANYLDKRLLAVPENLYAENRLPNMAMILNDTDPKRSYGYGYGGYGYGYVVVEKPWYKKIFNRS